ncbi:hypothetical protein R9C00_16615 [Flammeovirgaceae bacterium SG7u.111]|nr:hypothetical protein [Flammeovirgaceae bacterium SG7u.132]WPO33326.1 hypothetical protein R9C00_16615 [Flammeovirgaceae bacterium SG7u.111]
MIETKLYLDGDIVCKVFSENEEEEEVIDKHIKMIKKQVSILRHLSKYITAFITTISTTAGYLVQLESNIPNNLGLIIPTVGFVFPLFFKKQFFGGAMSIFTFITKTFTKDSLKSFTNVS